jgi:hypothetical protein
MIGDSQSKILGQVFRYSCRVVLDLATFSLAQFVMLIVLDCDSSVMTGRDLANRILSRDGRLPIQYLM